MRLSEFLGSLPIASASAITFEQMINEGFDTLDKILGMTQNQISEVGKSSSHSIGDSRAEKIYSSLHSEYISDLLQYQSLWVDSSPANVSSDGFFAGKKVCMTGTAPVPRNDLKKMLQQAGALVQSSVGSSTEYLLIEDVNSTSAKAQNARKFGTKLLSYQEALSYLK